MSRMCHHPLSSNVQIFLEVCGLVLLVAAALLSGHPQCTDFQPPFKPPVTRTRRHCNRYWQSSCCTAEQDHQLREVFHSVLSTWANGSEEATISPRCRSYLRALQCMTCSPYAAHAFDVEVSGERIGNGEGRVPGICPAVCRPFIEICGLDLMTALFLGDNEQRNSSESESSSDESAKIEFCRRWSLNDPTYCFPNVHFTELNLPVPGVTPTAGRGDSPAAGADDSDCLCVEEVADELVNPLTLASSRDGTGRMFIGEQKGIIKILTSDREVLADPPYLDMSKSVGTANTRGDERGLLGLDFHPNFKHNRKFYTYYSHYTRSGRHYSIVSEWTQSTADPNRADHSSERRILEFRQPQSNHNGGQITFGPDGYLYVFSGDGGGAGDKHGKIGNAQNMSTFLGKILRIDVDTGNSGATYRVPRDNPFFGVPRVLPEIYAFGLRNPWRCSFDRGNAKTGYGAGRLFCGDVGQGKREEIDIIEKGGNYGWRGLEGTLCYDRSTCNHMRGTSILPIHDYNRTVGRSVTGGYVYRGCQWPNMEGKYFYGDYHSGKLFTLSEDASGWKNKEVCLGSKKRTCTSWMSGRLPRAILSFGEDEQGEIYILAVPHHRSKPIGKILRLVDPRTSADPTTCARQSRRQQSSTMPATPPPVTSNLATQPRPTAESAAEDAECTGCLRRQNLNFDVREICRANHTHYVKARVLFLDTNYPGREGLLLVRILDWFGRSAPHGQAGAKRSSNAFLWVVKDAVACGCMNFTLGNTYLIMAQSRQNSFLLDFNTVKVEWQPTTHILIQSYLTVKGHFC